MPLKFPRDVFISDSKGIPKEKQTKTMPKTLYNLVGVGDLVEEIAKPGINWEVAHKGSGYILLADPKDQFKQRGLVLRDFDKQYQISRDNITREEENDYSHMKSIDNKFDLPNHEIPAEMEKKVSNISKKYSDYKSDASDFFSEKMNEYKTPQGNRGHDPNRYYENENKKKDIEPNKNIMENLKEKESIKKVSKYAGSGGQQTIITVENYSQYAIFKYELEGQFSDGAWENSNGTEWLWRNVEVNVGSPNITTTYYGNKKKSYDFFMLIPIIGDRMLALGKMGKVTQEDSYLEKADYLEDFKSFEELKKSIEKVPPYARPYLEGLPDELLQQYFNTKYDINDLKHDLRVIYSIIQEKYVDKSEPKKEVSKEPQVTEPNYTQFYDNPIYSKKLSQIKKKYSVNN